MTLDDLIKMLQEAKEHGIQGNRHVICIDDYNGDELSVKEVKYDNKNVQLILT